jgi:hypothetical protein
LPNIGIAHANSRFYPILVISPSDQLRAILFRVSLRLIVKRAAQLVSLIIVFLPAALSGFGRITAIYLIGAHTMALIPGIIGNMLRAAWYRLTLIHCSQDVTISFGTFFSQQSASVARNVSIGSYCVIGSASIGEGTLISSSAQSPVACTITHVTIRGISCRELAVPFESARTV